MHVAHLETYVNMRDSIRTEKKCVSLGRSQGFATIAELLVVSRVVIIPDLATFTYWQSYVTVDINYACQIHLEVMCVAHVTLTSLNY